MADVTRESGTGGTTEGVSEDERRLEELGLIRPAVIVCLGKFAWDAACLLLSIRPRPRFGHLAEFEVPDGPVVLGSFHPSPQNPFTGKLTEPMLDAVFERAAHIAGDGVMVPRARNP